MVYNAIFAQTSVTYQKVGRVSAVSDGTKMGCILFPQVNLDFCIHTLILIQLIVAENGFVQEVQEQGIQSIVIEMALREVIITSPYFFMAATLIVYTARTRATRT
jgi:hypothetical protein